MGRVELRQILAQAEQTLAQEPGLAAGAPSSRPSRGHIARGSCALQFHRILAKDSVDEPIRRLVVQKVGLFDTYARQSAAKEAHAGAVDGSWTGKELTQEGVVRAEQARLGMAL